MILRRELVALRMLRLLVIPDLVGMARSDPKYSQSLLCGIGEQFENWCRQPALD